MIKPIYRQKFSKSGVMGRLLRDALLWWRKVLATKVSERRSWKDDATDPPCHLFVDAASTPPKCAAVLARDGSFLYTDCAPSRDMMEWFHKRADKQITSLVSGIVRACPCLCFRLQETLAILIALNTFATELEGRKVVLFFDNSGAEKATAKGSAKAFDHNLLIHEIWSHTVSNEVKLWIERVPSELNVADLPSRFEYELVDSIAAWKAPWPYD